MTSGVVGMRSHMSSMRALNSIDLNTNCTPNRMVVSIEDIKKYVVQLLEQLDALMAEDICDHKSSHKLIAKVCHYLKLEGSRLDDDSAFKQQLDLYFDLLRNILRKPKLSPLVRTMILEVIELRASNWVSDEDIENYYLKKMSELESTESYSTANHLTSELQKSQSFASIAVIAGDSNASTKLNKQNKVTGKTFIRDEVRIRNGDSGKVTAGAKERLVQITGPSEESIERAKELIETTIKRNASPVPFECPNRSFDPNFDQNISEINTTVPQVLESTPIKRSEAIPPIKMTHNFMVEVNDQVIHLSTTNYDLGLKAQQLLKQSLHLDTHKKPSEQQIKQIEANDEKRHSFSESNPCDDFDFNAHQLVDTNDPKSDIMAALDSASKRLPVQPIQPKVNRIQRSSSQGTVPVGRTSLRFMSKSEGHDSNEEPKITYERQFLMDCSQLPASQKIPNIEVMAQIYKKTPDIIRKHNNSGQNNNSSAALLKSQSFTQSRAITVDNWE